MKDYCGPKQTPVWCHNDPCDLINNKTDIFGFYIKYFNYSNIIITYKQKK
jgi:hypothetical protein